MTLIDAVEIRQVVVPLHNPFRSAATEIRERRLALVRLGAGGAEGWGECGPIPGYGADTYAAAGGSLAEAADQILGLSVPDDHRLDSVLDGIPSPSARFAVECAYLDLAGYIAGLQVWKRLGGRDPRIPIGAVVPFGSTDEVLAAAVDAAAAGYRRVKLKVTSPTHLDLVRAVAAEIAGADLAIDANGAFSSADIPALERIDDLGLCFIEQPFDPDNTETSAELAARIETPICLDESIISPQAAQRALEAGACSMVAVKPARLGGFRASRQVLEIAAAAGAGAWVGGMLESGIGRAGALAAATLPGTTAPADLAPPRRFFTTDLLRDPWTVEEGAIELSDRPGLGFEVDADAVERFSTRVDRWRESF